MGGALEAQAGRLGLGVGSVPAASLYTLHNWHALFCPGCVHVFAGLHSAVSLFFGRPAPHLCALRWACVCGLARPGVTLPGEVLTVCYADNARLLQTLTGPLGRFRQSNSAQLQAKGFWRRWQKLVTARVHELHQREVRHLEHIQDARRLCCKYAANQTVHQSPSACAVQEVKANAGR